MIHDSEGSLRGEVLDGHAQVMIDGPTKHSWSPCLWLSYSVVGEDEDVGENVADGDAPGNLRTGSGDSTGGKKLRVRGLFGPHPGLWTFFATMYCVSAFVIFFGIVWGWSQLLLEKTPSAFVAIPAGMALAAVLYFVSLSGRALAHDEMDALTEKLDRALVADSER